MGINAIVYIDSAELVKKISESIGDFEIFLWEARSGRDIYDIVSEKSIDIIITTEKLSKTSEVEQARELYEEKIPIFIFSKDVEEYTKDIEFKTKFLKTLKEGLKLNILPLRETKKLEFSVKTDEKREFERIGTKIPVNIIKDDGSLISGFVRNLSAGGLSANSLKDIPDGKYTLEFGISESEKFSLNAVKLRSEYSFDHWHIAFKFSQIHEGDKQKLAEFSNRVVMLRKMPVFAGLSDDEIRLIAGLIKEVQYFENSVIFSEGVTGRNLYIIKAGAVRIIKGLEKEKKTLAMLHSGDFFGEMALILPIKRTAAAVAARNSVLFKISRSDFEARLMENKEISFKLYRNFVFALVRRLQNTNEKFLDLPFNAPEVKF